MIPEPATVESADAPPIPATSTGRVMTGMISSCAAAFITTVVPASLLLATHLTVIAGVEAAAAFSLVSGVAGLAALISNPLAGRISDRTAARFGRRRTWILTGGLLAAVLAFGIAFTTEVWQVALVWTIVQVLVQFQLAAAVAFGADQLNPAKRGVTSGIMGVVILLGPVIALGVASALAETPVLQWAVVSGAAVVLTLLAVVVIRDPQHRATPSAHGFGRNLLRTFWLSPRKHPAFGWAWVVRFLITCTWAGTTYLAFVVSERIGGDPQVVSTTVFQLLLVGILSVCVTCGVTGWLSDRFRRQKPFVIAGGLGAAVGLVVLGFAPDLATLLVGMTILGLGYGCFLATDFALCIRMLPDAESRGNDFAILNIASTLPASLVPFAAPLLLGIGGFPAFFIALAVVGVLGAAATMRIPDIGQEGDPRFALLVADEQD